MTYFQVLISAETPEQAAAIRDALLARTLILGGPILKGPAVFWWKGDLTALEEYAYLLTYTRADLKDAVTAEAERVSAEEVCMISFMPFEGNPALIKLLDETFVKAQP